MQEKLESTRWGRVLLSVVLTVVLCAVLVVNLPPSHTRDTQMKVFRPILSSTGLRQNWGVFAPNPPRSTREFLARIDYADGTSEAWRPPKGGKGLSAYRYYRWRKLSDAAQSRNDRAVLWRPLARWIAREHGREGARVVRVQFIRQRLATPAPGTDQRSRWRSNTYYTLEFKSSAPPR
ncbi:MAG TPA: hypothetical protein VNA57_10460 [Acidimicrobiales bacterium]|nr:hypothetical protein [Acidimicrobiales bacterium]